MMVSPKEILELEEARAQKDSPMKTEKSLRLVQAKKNLSDFKDRFEVDNDAVANRVRVAAENSELAFGEIAELCGVGSRVVSNWAQTGQISKERIPTFCHLTGVSVEWLLTGVDDGVYSKDDTADKTAFTRPLNLKAGPSAETIMVVPTVEPHDLAKDIGFDDSKLLPDCIKEWKLRPDEFPSFAIQVHDKDHVRTPTFSMQMTASVYPALPRGTILFFSHNILPSQGEFSIWLTELGHIGADFEPVNQRPTVVAGFTHYLGTGDAFPTLEGHFYEYSAAQPIQLTTAPYSTLPSDIVLPGGTIKGKRHILKRRFLGTLVATQTWTHPTSVDRQTTLTRRLNAIEEFKQEDWGDWVEFTSA